MMLVAGDENCVVESMSAVMLMHFLLFSVHISIRCWVFDVLLLACCRLWSLVVDVNFMLFLWTVENSFAKVSAQLVDWFVVSV